MKFRVLFFVSLSMFACGTCQIKGVIHQYPFVVAELGSSVILPCSYSFDMIHTVSWFKQTVGKKPLLIAYSNHLSGGFIYQNGFDKVERYSFEVGTNFFNMSIINLKENDFTNYYCAVTFMSTIEFGEGTILLHSGKDSASGATVLQRPVSDRLHPGDSVTLQCSVISQICAGEYSIYWFRHSSEHSHPGLIYTRDNRSDQCMERSEKGSSTQSCVYSLSQTELRSSDAGIYYCAVATCGKIHFGNGTKLIIEASLTFWNPVVLTLFAISIISIIVNIFLVRLIHKNHRKEASKQPTNQRNQTESDALNYVSLSFSKRLTTSKRSSGKTSQEQSVYSQITKQ
ncbi:immunoglobulin kappa light chain-like [Carassius auratus]|uniref:immunoglobulin kappa light chain-like n=1 Tax=Carassius auratus TaxID=7957 RepID=UPI000E42A53F|nr:immunoglobulin kappa light chain-like [Carassius auratus]